MPVMMKAAMETGTAKSGPKNGLRAEVNEKNWDMMPHSESAKGINTIQENAYAIRKKKNKGCCRIASRRLLEAAPDAFEVTTKTNVIAPELCLFITQARQED